MHFNFTCIKYCVVFALGILFGYLEFHNVVYPRPATTGIYVLPAHLPVDVNWAEAIYTDTEADTTYYSVVGGDFPVDTGDIVYFSSEVECEVVERSVNGFYIKVPDGEVYAGLSGAPVWSKGQIVGYVSTLYSNNVVWCIWNIHS